MKSARPREPLDVGWLRAALVGADANWRRVDVVEETGSTNADLLARAADGEDIAGAVVLAEHQIAGRGRHGRSWSAPARSQVALSAGIGVGDAPPDAWGWLPLLAGVAVVDAVSDVTGVSAGLKWPNDVLVDGGKLAGILAEVAAPDPVIVVGLGLNVSMTAQEAPDPNATSLTMVGVDDVDRTRLVIEVLRQLAFRVGGWRAARGADARLAADYRSHSRTIGNKVRASLPGGRAIEGVAADVDELGRLRIDTGTEVVTVSAGDIAHLRPITP